MLHQPTPPVHPPDPIQRADCNLKVFSRLLYLLHLFSVIHGTKAAQKEDAESQYLPVGDLIGEHTYALREAVCSLQKKLLEANLAPGDAVPLDLISQADALWEHLSKLSDLETFYHRNRAAGQDGGLNALFAPKFILQADRGDNSEDSSMTLDEFRQVAKVLRELTEAFKTCEPGSISMDEADHLPQKYV